MNAKRTRVSEVMHKGCSCVKHDVTCVDAAKQMSEECLGALPICGPDDKLIGMLTDRDIVVHCLAADKDPSVCTVGELASGRVIWVHDHQSVQQALDEMETHLVRRMPVIDQDMRLCGMISQADIASHLDARDTAELVEVISRADPRQSVAY